MNDQDATRSSASGLFRRGIRVVARYVREEPRTFTISVIGASLYAAATVGSTVVLGRVTQNVILPAFTDTGVTSDAVWGAAAALIIVGFLRATSIIMRRYCAGLTAFRVQAHWRRRISDLYLDVPLDFHRDHPTGELLAHTDSDVLAATEVMSPVPFATGVIALIVFAVISLALVDLWMMALGLLLFPALAVLNRTYTKRIERPSEVVQEQVGAVSRIVHESIDGALVVKTLGRSQLEIDRLAVAADHLRATRVHVGRLRGSFEPVLQGLPTVGAVCLLALGAWEISVDRITTGQLVQGIALFSILAFPMQVVGYFLEELPRAVVSTARLDRVMASPSAPVPDPTEARELPEGGLDVVVDDVSFAYDPDQPVLSGVSFRIEPGEIVALVGSTGSGKTTLCELLVRLTDPSSGAVRLGGVDLRHADPDSLHRHAALVFQETFLFADTLWENVVLGLDATNDEVRHAMAVAQADRFVGELPMGIATVVGERGVTLSGGQRQRVALARALLRRPSLLILDDATSAVDPKVESEILGGLRRDLSTTTLVVAQRVSTIELADRVVFLDEGRVVAEGHHDQLIDTVPAYERIVRAYEVAAS